MLTPVLKSLAAACLLIMCMAPYSHAQNILPKKWQSAHFSGNPLVGTVFKGTGEKTSLGNLALAVRLYRFVLLGEQHDNPDHHVIQARLLQQVSSGQRKPVVVFEMVPRGYAQQISKYDLKTDPALDKFAQRLDWEKRGWYSWDIYRPIALSAAKSSLQMIAGNLDRDVIRSVSKNGFDALTVDDQKLFGLNNKLAETDRASLLKELETSHCGMMPKSAIPAMVNVQRAKDGSMANAMVSEGLEFGAVLIAGNGHVRKDRGVPLVLRRLLPGSTDRKINENLTIKVPNANSVSIALIEVTQNGHSFEDYNLLNQLDQPLYDFVVFTPTFDVTDHCAALRGQMSEKKKSP